jgi:hypothetical protein
LLRDLSAQGIELGELSGPRCGCVWLIRRGDRGRAITCDPANEEPEDNRGDDKPGNHRLESDGCRSRFRRNLSTLLIVHDMSSTTLDLTNLLLANSDGTVGVNSGKSPVRTNRPELG